MNATFALKEKHSRMFFYEGVAGLNANLPSSQPKDPERYRSLKSSGEECSHKSFDTIYSVILDNGMILIKNHVS